MDLNQKGTNNSNSAERSNFVPLPTKTMLAGVKMISDFLVMKYATAFQICYIHHNRKNVTEYIWQKEEERLIFI
jgi:hypothetical protein